MNKKNWMSVATALSWLTQLGLSIAAPPVLCVLLALWLQKSLALGAWVVLVGLFLGLGAGACSFYQFYKLMQRQANKKKKDDEPHSFNG
ncbi:MAG: AtpZ/AtpI family protein [Oscillospiraceae bacterium]|nr:AtpZ/AtpI family protein [Oscillospiraceae bacterium]